MSHKTTESNNHAGEGGSADPNTNHPAAEETVSHELTITLPEGSESIADAIVTNREMLRQPADHGIATDEEITHLSEAMQEFSAEAEEATRQYDATQSRVSELQDTVERQQGQIDELQSTVDSLVEILGTEAEWDTFGDG